MLYLIEKGLSREEAYRIVQRISKAVWDEDEDFQEMLIQDPEIRRYMDVSEIKKVLMPDSHTRNLDQIYRRVFGDRSLSVRKRARSSLARSRD
jgi:adenylosuccinate lyase